MPTNNSINLTSAGVVKYDGAGTFTGVSPLTVPDGGTGVASATAYAVLCGGTTSTGAFQSIAGVGTSGQVLTSNGAAALPTFQAASSGVSISKTTLTSAQMKALRTSPITLIAAQGANKVICVLNAYIKLVYGGTNAFTVASVNLALRYVNNSGQTSSVAAGLATGAGWLDQTASSMTIPIFTAAATNAASTSFENQILVLANNGASDVAGNAAGNNSVIVNVAYTTLDFS